MRLARAGDRFGGQHGQRRRRRASRGAGQPAGDGLRLRRAKPAPGWGGFLAPLPGRLNGPPVFLDLAWPAVKHADDVCLVQGTALMISLAKAAAVQLPAEQRSQWELKGNIWKEILDG